MKKLFSLVLVLFLFLSVNAVLAEIVMCNTKTGKIHKLSCPSAKSCTVNCIKIDKKEAKARGGVACKKCGG